MHMAKHPPGTYEHSVEEHDTFSDKTKTRLIRDSKGDYHKIEMLPYVLSAYDDLAGRKEAPDYKVFSPNGEVTRALMDEALCERERTNLPLDLCFQSVVLARIHEKDLRDIGHSE